MRLVGLFAKEFAGAGVRGVWSLRVGPHEWMLFVSDGAGRFRFEYRRLKDWRTGRNLGWRGWRPGLEFVDGNRCKCHPGEGGWGKKIRMLWRAR